MKRVEVEITEILQKKVWVEIPDNGTEDEAVGIVVEQYNEDRLSLDARDFADVSFGLSQSYGFQA